MFLNQFFVSIKSIRIIVSVLVLLALISGAGGVRAATIDAGYDNQPADGPVYTVSIFQFGEQSGRRHLRRYMHQITPLVEVHGGYFLTAPIHLRGNLKTPALPPTTVDLDADVVTIAEFPDMNAFQSFADDPDVVAIESKWSTRLADEIRFLGVIPPEFAIFPVLGSTPLRDRPAFLLVNAIQLAPDGIDSFNQYSTEAVPMAMSVGTNFFAPITPIAVQKGSFDYTFFAITEWTNPGVFQQFHRSPAYLDIVHLRNDVLTQFVEMGGVAQTRRGH